MTDGTEPQTNAEDAMRFLEWLRPGGPWPVTTIAPDDGRTPTTWLNTAADIRTFVAAKSGQTNVYYTVGVVREGVKKKPSKAEIVSTRHLHADVDPPKDLPPTETEQWIADALARIEGCRSVPPASYVGRSGNGLHLLWKLDEEFHVGGADAQIDAIETFTRGIMLALDADKSTINVDRLLRLPGTINLPDKKKRERGRQPRLATIVELTDRVYALAEFPSADAKDVSSPPRAGSPRTKQDRDRAVPLDKPADLDKWEVPVWIHAVIITGADPANPERWGGDRSAAVWAVTCELARRRVPPGLIAGILTDSKWGISAHVFDQRRPADYAWRQVEKAYAAAEAEGEPFQTDKDGKPYANQHNIRLALSKLGVAVRHDKFADRMLVEGVDGCGPHLDDAALDRIYLDIDDRFRFRPAWEFFVKVVAVAARRSPFHPVCDYLDALQWDGVPRLDGWLPTYGGAPDTPYSRAVGALMLVAAVRRVRQPGVKFDEMLVLESKQGTNKSSALRVLATRDEWFIDDLPLNAESKVVIERLAGRWIAEAAELKGMRKGEVEHLKGFLSRQQDTARMSYARLPVIVPRQCVIFGTTNSERYLRDLTGNRRFWPVKVEGFDLDRLRADVDQLWAEAVTREAGGESIRLDPALWAAAEEEQDARRIEDPFVSSLSAAIREQNGKISAEAVWAILKIRAGHRTQDDNARVGDAMRELGFERKKLRFGGPSEWGYARGTEEEQRQLIVIDDGRVGDGYGDFGEPY